MSDKKALLFVIASVLLIILGVKLALIGRYGTITPFWDQWGGEGALLYKPFLLGDLTFRALIHSHNEHRIFFTRLLGLAELELFGGWFPTLQMIVNALIHTATIGLLLWLLLPPLDTLGRALVLFATLVLFSIPFGWENTLAGFQSQFYFLFGFSLIALRLFQSAPAFSRRWFAATLFCVAAYFNMASGALTMLAAIAMCVLQILLGARHRTHKEWLALVPLVAILAVQLFFVHHISAHDRLAAKGPLDFAGAFLKTAAWPFPSALAIILNAPAILMVVRLFKEKPRQEAYPWLLIGLFLWLGTQWLALAYGRAVDPTSSRYTDTLIIGPITNVAALAYLMRNMTRRFILTANGTVYRREGQRMLPAFATIGIVLALALAAVLSWSGAFRGAAERGNQYVFQTDNLRSYLQTGDIAHLKDKPSLHIPYPDPERLASLASDPAIKSILDPDLTGQPLRTDLLLPAWATHVARASFNALLHLGLFIAGIGFGLIVSRGLLDARTQPNAADTIEGGHASSVGSGAGEAAIFTRPGHNNYRRAYLAALLLLVALVGIGAATHWLQKWKTSVEMAYAWLDPVSARRANPLFSPVTKVNPDNLAAADNCLGVMDRANGQLLHGNRTATPERYLTLAGWLISQAGDMNRISPQVLVEVAYDNGRKSFYTAQRTPRPDVKTHFKRPDLPDVGYTARIDIPAGIKSYTVTVAAKDKDAVTLCRNLSVQVRP
jgi:hypothetical protein